MFGTRFGLGLAVTLLAAAALAACSTKPPATGGGVSTTPTASSVTTTTSIVLLTGDKALYAAEAAYVGGLQLVNTGLDANLIHGATATTVKGYVQKADDAIQAAKAARSIGDTAVETTQALAALGLIGQATAVVPAATPATH